MREMNHEILALISDFFAQVLEMWPMINTVGWKELERLQP